MTVKELINELKKCNPDDIVMYDAENAIKNAGGGRRQQRRRQIILFGICLKGKSKS